MSVLNKNISYYPSKNATTKGVEVNLLHLLQSDKHKAVIQRLRNEPDATTQKAMKETLPCYTVAGTFSRRFDEGLIQPSGLAVVDLDSAEDCDIIYLLNGLKELPYIAYAGLSCRGKRLFCIVPFATDAYTKHYIRLVKSFEDWGLPMGDDCHKAISQPRFVSWNDESTQFFNHEAKPYHLLPAEKKYFTVKRNYQHTGAGAAPANPFRWCVEQINKSHSFTEKKNRHKYIMALARYCNIKGLPEDETLSGCLSFAQPDIDLPFPDTEIIKIVKHIYATQSDSHAKRPFAQPAAFKPQEQPKPRPQANKPPQPKETAQVRELQPVEDFKAVISANEGISTVNERPAEETEICEISVKEQRENNERTTIEQVNNRHEPDPKPESWDHEITELERYFSTATIPAVPVKLNPYSTITDVYLCVSSHLATVKANNGNRTFIPYLERLRELKTILTINTN